MGIVLTIVAVGAGVWTWFALSVHAQATWRLLLQASAVAAVLGVVGGVFAGFAWQAAAVLVVWVGACAIWYLTRRPRSDRDWIPETRHGVTATMGDVVTLHNVRQFRWATKAEYAERWEDGVFDPSAITSVDMYLSVWGNARIAHSMAAFGFADGRYVVFSGETRRVQGDRFSIAGGFFRRFELVLLATDERDAIHLRAEVRKEKVYRYPVDMPDGAAEKLFLAYAQLGNDLAARPRWYNTVTANCTTVPFRLVKAVAKRVRFGWPVLLSGYLPEYLDRMGVLPHGIDRDRARVPVVGDVADYSAAIRGQRN